MNKIWMTLIWIFWGISLFWTLSRNWTEIFIEFGLRTSCGRNGAGARARLLPMAPHTVKDVQQRDIYECAGDNVPINMVKGIGHLRDPRLNKVTNQFCKFTCHNEIFTLPNKFQLYFLTLKLGNKSVPFGNWNFH